MLARNWVFRNDLTSAKVQKNNPCCCALCKPAVAVLCFDFRLVMTDAGLTAATTTSGVASSCGQIQKSLAFVLLPVVHSEQVAWCFPLEFQSSSQPIL